jgi:hypothetical protein
VQEDSKLKDESGDKDKKKDTKKPPEPLHIDE